MRYLLDDTPLPGPVNPDAVNILSMMMTRAVFGRQTPISQSIAENASIRSQLLDQPNSLGATPLFVAALKNRVDVVEYLLQRGANAEARTSFGWTPLFAAAANGHLEVVKLLVELGKASVNFQAEFGGATALYIASRCGHFEVVEYLVDQPFSGRKLTTQDTAVMLGDRETVDVEWTPLQVAEHHGHARIVKFFQKYGKVRHALKKTWKFCTSQRPSDSQVQATLKLKAPSMAKLHESDLCRKSRWSRDI